VDTVCDQALALTIADAFILGSKHVRLLLNERVSDAPLVADA
jgi:hypothetical protein